MKVLTCTLMSLEGWVRKKLPNFPGVPPSRLPSLSITLSRGSVCESQWVKDVPWTGSGVVAGVCQQFQSDSISYRRPISNERESMRNVHYLPFLVLLNSAVRGSSLLWCCRRKNRCQEVEGRQSRHTKRVARTPVPLNDAQLKHVKS